MTFTQSPLLNILIIVLIALAIIIGFNLANIYYLKKMNVNKWILFAIAFVSFAISFVLSIYYPTSPWQILPLVVSLFTFLWFMEVRRRPVKGDKNAKPVVMKPKAKPSRAKKPLAEATVEPTVSKKPAPTNSSPKSGKKTTKK